MPIRQLSISTDNKQGKLSQFASLLDTNRIDLIALSIMNTNNLVSMRIVVDDTTRAAEIIRATGYTVDITEVLALLVPDKPGGLAHVLNVLEEALISVLYVYSTVRGINDNAVIILKTDENERAITLLAYAGVTMLTGAQVRAL